MDKDTFWNVERSKFKTEEGEVDLPIFYYDFSSVIFNFMVKPEKVSALLEGTALSPCILANNMALVIIVFFEYRDSSVGIYNEVGLCSLTYSKALKKPFFYLPDVIKKGDKWKIAAYVHNLPVTTKAANAAGREIWGYPKFVTEIPFSLTKNTFKGSVLDPDTGDDILSIDGKMGPVGIGPLLRGIDIVTHTIHKGAQIRTHITTEGKAAYHLFPKMKLLVGSGSHVMNENLIRLDLHGARPIAMITSYNTRSRLPAGVDIAKVPDFK